VWTEFVLRLGGRTVWCHLLEDSPGIDLRIRFDTAEGFDVVQEGSFLMLVEPPCRNRDRTVSDIDDVELGMIGVLAVSLGGFDDKPRA
jgi:hypothetical protein